MNCPTYSFIYKSPLMEDIVSFVTASDIIAVFRRKSNGSTVFFYKKPAFGKYFVFLNVFCIMDKLC